MNPSTVFSAPSLSHSRCFARLLSVLLLTLWLVLPPFVQAQTGAAAPTAAQREAEPRTLKLGEPIERELAGGQQHTYQITLAEGQHLTAVVEQRGIDVIVRLMGPDGKLIFTFDAAVGQQGQEQVSQVAKTAGSYQVNLQPKQPTAVMGRYEIRLVELRAATERDRALQEARELNADVVRLAGARKFDEAFPLAERVLAIREKVLGTEHAQVASSLNNLATLHRDKGDYVKAELLYQRALEIREKVLGPEHRDVAISLSNLANIYRTKEDYTKAEPLYRRALSIQEKLLGRDHLEVANTAERLAGLLLEKGEITKSESLYLGALSIREKEYGKEHPAIAGTLGNLGRFYLFTGRDDIAEPLLSRALAIQEKALGQEHPSFANTLNHLGHIYSGRGNYAEAESYYQRTLTVWEKAFGKESKQVADILHNLAGIYTQQEDHLRAEAFLLRTLAIREKVFGKNHSDIAAALWSLAQLYLTRNDYPKAEEFYQRALDIYLKSQGPDHDNVSSTFRELARLHSAKGDFAQAVSAKSRAAAITERNIALNLLSGSERQKQEYMNLVREETDEVISLHAKTFSHDSAARDLAISAILQRKGRVLDAVLDGFAIAQRHAGKESSALLNQLKEVTAQLARLIFAGPQNQSLVEYQEQVKALEARKENLETEVSNRSAEFRAQSRKVTIKTVQAAIPPNTALVEIARYRPFNPRWIKSADRFSEPCYVAYVLRQQGETQWVELGGARAIDQAVEKLRQALRDKNRADVKQLARAVDQKVMQPVRALLGKTRRVLIAPDGALNLVPFAALVDEKGHYLVQHYEFSYLTSGRDLLRLQVKQPNKHTAMVVANPDFGDEAKDGQARERILKYRPSAKVDTGDGGVLAEYYFPPLGGTAEEARALKTMMADATVLTEAQATEAALKQLSSPRILHVATHGFFLEDQKPAAGEERLLRPIGGEAPLVGRIENPLLRSGLALAGANRLKSGLGNEEDGILTAQEAAGLDLWGTKLVVLSACDTGVGEVKNGEGVYGLRRALVLAGSETQVMSLWPVSDKGTRDLMIEYYRRLLRGEGRSAALRAVQLKMLKAKAAADEDEDRLLVAKSQQDKDRILKSKTGRKSGERSAPPKLKDYSHPYYWASFIQSGEWANLEGNR